MTFVLDILPIVHKKRLLFYNFSIVELTQKLADVLAVPAARGQVAKFAFKGLLRSKVENKMRKLWKFPADVIY